MFRSDSKGGDVSGMVRLEQADDKTGHGSVLHHYPVCNRFRGSQQIFKSVAAVGLAINKTTLIQAPAFLYLRNCQRPHVIAGIGRRNQRDIRVSFRVGRLTAVKPPARSKFLKDRHIEIYRGTEERGADYSLFATFIDKCYTKPALPREINIQSP